MRGINNDIPLSKREIIESTRKTPSSPFHSPQMFSPIKKQNIQSPSRYNVGWHVAKVFEFERERNIR